jgi:hypothetical protein
MKTDPETHGTERERERERESERFSFLDCYSFIVQRLGFHWNHTRRKRERERFSFGDCYSFILQRVGFHWNNTQRKTEIERDSLLETLLFLHHSKARVSLESQSKEKSSSPLFLVSKQIDPFYLSVCLSFIAHPFSFLHGEKKVFDKIFINLE